MDRVCALQWQPAWLLKAGLTPASQPAQLKCCVLPHSTVQQEGAPLLGLQVDTKGLAIIDASVAPAAQELWLSGASHTQPVNSMHWASL